VEHGLKRRRLRRSSQNFQFHKSLSSNGLSLSPTRSTDTFEVKSSRSSAVKTCGGNRDEDPQVVLTSALDGSERAHSRCSDFTPEKSPLSCRLWHSFHFTPTFGSPCNTFPISPTPWRCCLFPLVEFAVEGKPLTVWAAQQERLSVLGLRI
jgi:hypothetical protein